MRSKAVADACCGQRQPKRVGAGGATNGMVYAQLDGGGALKSGHLLTKDKLLRLKHMTQGFTQLGQQRRILALQVEHGYGDGGRGRRRLAFHPTIVPAACAVERWRQTQLHTPAAAGRLTPVENGGKARYRCHIAGQAAAGLPYLPPFFCVHSGAKSQRPKPIPEGTKEIGNGKQAGTEYSGHLPEYRSQR